MGPKYEFTGETKNYEGHILHRIKRLSDNVIGGWIEKEENLSQDGSCWVSNGAKVYDDARIYDNATIWTYAHVYGNAKVYGNATVYDKAVVYDDAQVYGNANVYGKAKVYGEAKVYGNANVYGKAQIYVGAEVFGYAKVYGSAKVYGDAGYNKIFEYAQVYDNAEICGEANVNGHAEVYGNAKVYGYAAVFDNAKIYDNAIVEHYSGVYGNAEVCGNALVGSEAYVYGNIKLTSGKYFSGEYHSDDEDLSNDSSKEVVQNFIYKVDDSNEITTQIEYNSIDEFFVEPIKNDIKLDTLVICTVDTKEPLIKLQKVEIKDKTEFKFIVDITNEDGDDFIFRSIIKSQEQLNQLIQQTIDALKNYPQFSKYVNDLENCL